VEVENRPEALCPTGHANHILSLALAAGPTSRGKLVAEAICLRARNACWIVVAELESICPVAQACSLKPVRSSLFAQACRSSLSLKPGAQVCSLKPARSYKLAQTLLQLGQLGQLVQLAQARSDSVRLGHLHIMPLARCAVLPLLGTSARWATGCLEAPMSPMSFASARSLGSEVLTRSP
jgi:hypothetical protein